MATTSAQPNTKFVQSITTLIPDVIEQETKEAAEMLWSVTLSLLADHWLLVMSIFFIILITATAKAMFGRWGMLGSVLYNLFYFGTLFFIGIIWGPEVFVSDYFNVACTAFLYPVCYIIVGRILKRFRT